MEQLGDEMSSVGTTYGFQNINDAWTVNLITVAILGSLDGGKEILYAGATEKLAILVTLSGLKLLQS
ncbi:MAG: hypothetical protein ACK5LY_03845 [Lachnospirales bacterium]